MFALTSWLTLPYFLAWIGNPVYQQAVHWYRWLIFAMILNTVGVVPHYALYSHGFDKPIIQSQMAALLIFGLSVLGLSLRYGPLTVPMGLSFAFAGLLILKFIAYKNIFKSPKASGPFNSL